ncbi:MAG: hypothetical protein DYG89_23580 [Caldilinea sp. CFX5]|nr:hypothetical protein [Caldilinea sp. CFX5]
MSQLGILAQHRKEILLAELAGLLHNVGKLDPNFLASKVNNESVAKQKIVEHWLDIPNYRFDRFSAPDVTLLHKEVKDRITERDWESRAKLANELKVQFGTSAEKAAIEALIQNWDEAKKIHPLIAKQLEAIWQFHAFQISNGPLYQCLALRRQIELHSLKETYERSQEALASFDMTAVPPKERHTIREKLQKAAKEAEENFQKTRDAIYAEEKRQQQSLETKFRDIKLSIVDESWSIADLLALFWDDFFYQLNGDGYKRQSALAYWLSTPKVQLPALLILSHGEISGAEKENVEAQQTPWEHLCVATAFGYEKTAVAPYVMAVERQQLLNDALSTCWALTQEERTNFLTTAETILKLGLGDTQWPINEINLWDYASTITALFKSSVAKAVFERKLPKLGDMRWRLLSIRYDGLGYLSQVHRISDLLARRDALNQALDAVQVIVEAELPLGNEIYRDENGSVLVVPSLASDTQELDFLQLYTGEDRDSLVLERLLAHRFANAHEKSPLDGELAPVIVLSGPLRGRELRLTEITDWHEPPLRSDLELLNKTWQEVEISGEICTVCGVRLQGYGPQHWKKHQHERHKTGEKPDSCQVCKAQERAVCQTCEQRRADRSQTWATNTVALTNTIWLDEVADVNGRAALVVGQFELNDWLNGRLVETMKKPVSFARSRRIWETTRTFWQEIEQDTFSTLLADDRRRLFLWFNPIPNLGAFHVYELELDGTNLSLVWHPSTADGTGGYFISADNFCYLARCLGAEPEIYIDSATSAIFIEEYINKRFIETRQSPVLYNADKTRKEQRNLATGCSIVRVTYQATAYSTAIPILAEPRTFMALVPADKALTVIDAIKTKYEREMGKVRNRLPLHLGAVYFHRRTPLRVALDAGRQMLQQTALGGDTPWIVKQVQSGPLPKAGKPLATGTQQFTITISVELEQQSRTFTWHIPAVMGDGVTPDQWYPYVFVQNDVSRRQRIVKGRRPQSDGTTTECWLIHAAELQKGDQIYFTAATFDVQWLGISEQRFEIAYDATGQRLTHPTRPYLLDDLATIQKVWDLLSDENGLTTSQIYALRDLVETKRDTWAVNATFRQLCSAAVYNAQWKKRPTCEDLTVVTTAAVSGLLADVIELYMGIMKQKPQRTEEDASS